MFTETKVPSHHPRLYQITVEGKIDPSWSDWLGGLQLSSWQAGDGRQVTTLSGWVADQAALRGLLIRLWDLNLVLLSLQMADESEMGMPPKWRASEMPETG